MKKLLFILVLFFLSKTANCQWPITQGLGSDSTLIRLGTNFNGGIKGRLIVQSSVDTTAANLIRIAYYTGGLLWTTNDGKFWIRNGSAWVLVAGSSGSVNIYNSDGTLSGNRNLTGAGFNLGFQGLAKFGVGADSVTFTMNGGAQFLIKPTLSYFLGNVGIGTATPSVALDVNGQMRMRTGATNGYIIQGDGNGVFSWVAKSTLYPTWQETLTTGSALTGINNISGGKFNLNFNNLGVLTMTSSPSGYTSHSMIKMTGAFDDADGILMSATNEDGDDSAYVNVYFSSGIKITHPAGLIYIRNLSNLSSQDRLIGIDNSTGLAGNITIGTGLSLSSGNLTATGSGGTVTNVASADGSITVTNPTSTVDLAVVKAPILTTSRTIGTVTGDATSAGSAFNGSANNTNALTLATVNSNVGSFTNASITVNAKGLVTAASSGSSAVTGSGTTNQMAYWSSSSGVTGDPAYTVDQSTSTFYNVTSSSNATLQPRGMIQVNNSSGVNPGYFGGRKSRNTFASPTAIQSGDGIVGLGAAGYSGSGYGSHQGLMQIEAQENFSGTNMGTRFSWYLIPSGSNESNIGLKMRLTGEGYLGLGTATPTSPLDIIGGSGTGSTDILGLKVSTSNTTYLAIGRWASNFNVNFLTNNAGYTGTWNRDVAGIGTSGVLLYNFTGDDKILLNVSTSAQSADEGGINRVRIAAADMVINDPGNDYDFRIESDGDANNLFSDGGTNRIGIGNNAPAEKLDVTGSTKTYHIVGGTSAPTIAAGAGAGTTPTVTVGSGSTDLGGYVNITTGTVPTGTNATIATVTFNVAYSAAPSSIILYPANALTATLSGVSMVFVDQSAITTTTFTIVSGTTALTGSSAYKFYYQVVQ